MSDAVKRELTIELCANTEWLTVFGPLSDLPGDNPDRHEAASVWWYTVQARIEAMSDDDDMIEVVMPPAHRRSCHAWHGCNTFCRHGHGLGSLDAMDEELWEAMTVAAIEEGALVVEEYAAEVAARYRFREEGGGETYEDAFSPEEAAERAE